NYPARIRRWRPVASTTPRGRIHFDRARLTARSHGIAGNARRASRSREKKDGAATRPPCSARKHGVSKTRRGYVLEPRRACSNGRLLLILCRDAQRSRDTGGAV